MQLIELNTKNFKRLDNHSFQFTGGMNFILGENGAGKSTLLRAIATALFGVQMVPGVADDIPTRGQSTWEVELIFSHKDSKYRVKRTKSSARVEKEGELVASGGTPVTKYIEELLNLTAKDYNLLIHSRQGETAYVLNYGATALQRKVEEFAGATVVEEIAKLASDRSRDSQLIASQMTILGDQELRAKEALIIETKEKIARAKYQLRAAEETANQTIEAPQVSSEDLRKQRNRYQRWEAEIVTSNRLREEWQEELDGLPAPTETSDSPAEELRELKAQLREMEEQVSKALNWQMSYEEVRKRLDEEVPPVEPDWEVEDELDLSELREEFQQLNTKWQLKHKELTDGVCPTCGTASVADIDSLRKEVDSLRAESLRLKSQLEDKEAVNREIRKKNEDYWAAAEAVKTYAMWKVDAEARAEEFKKKAADRPSDEEVESRRSQVADLEVQVRSAERIKDENRRLQKRKDQLVNQLASLDFPEAPCEAPTDEAIAEAMEAENRYHAAAAEARAAKKVIDALNAQIESEKSRIDQLEVEIQNVIENKTKRSELLEESETAKNLAKFLKDRRGDYISQIWDSVMYYATDALNTATNGWMSEVKIEDGKFFFREEGGWVSAVEASGAQEAFLGTALRIGMNKALYRGDAFMVFDEPTDGMREENARNLVAEIGNSSAQVLVITHRESDQGLAENIIEV